MNIYRNPRTVLFFCLLLLVLQTFAGCAGKKAAEPEPAEPDYSRCSFASLPSEFKVYAIGTYGGLEPVDIDVTGSGHETTKADVVVSDEEKPVVLVLSAYDSTIWNIGRTKNSRIAAVYASGYYKPGIAGLAKETPLRITSFEEQGQTKDGVCPYFYFYQEGAAQKTAGKIVRKILGRNVDEYVFKADEGVFYAGPMTNRDVVFAGESMLQATGDPQGKRGLARLVQEKAIRPATKADIDAWVKGAARKENVAESEFQDLQEEETYVVLREFRLPKGLYGSNAVAFIIPKGVAAPIGEKGHCLFYAMSDYSCTVGEKLPCR